MARVITLHTVHKTVKPGVAKTATTKAIPPVVEIIKPNTVIFADGEWLAELRRAGAVRDPRAGETVAVPIDQAPLHVEREEDVRSRLIATEATKPAKKAGRKPKNEADAGEPAGDGTGTSNMDTGAGDGDDDNNLV